VASHEETGRYLRGKSREEPGDKLGTSEKGRIDPEIQNELLNISSLASPEGNNPMWNRGS
jgi:hypothetical protein